MVKQLAIALKERGDDITVVSLTGSDSAIGRALAEHNIDVVALRKAHGFSISTLLQLARCIGELRPDVVHSHLPILHYVVPAVRLGSTKARLVHTFHSVAKHEASRRVKRAVALVMIRWGNVTPVALTGFVAETVSRTYRIRREGIQIVPNGTNLLPYQEAAASRQDSNIFRVLCVGRLVKAKNHAGLILQFNELSQRLGGNVRLTLVGDGPERSSIEALCSSLNLGEVVDLAGAQDDATSFYGNADAFVLSSLTEGFPMTVIEAMASALPVVCSALPTLRGIIVHSENGFTEDPASTDFNDRLVELYESAELRTKIGEAAAETALNFSAARMADEYRIIYRASQ